MGGRGAGSRMVSLPRARVAMPGEASPAEPAAAEEATKAKTVTLEEYLGPKGKPMNSVDAAKGANPHFSESLMKRDKKYTHNCQRCVWAVELRRRGYDVEAMARTTDDSYAVFDAKVPKSFVNVSTTPIQFKEFGSIWYPAKATEVTNAIKSFGEGTRGMLVMQGLRGGHVCNWEVKNGKALIYDGQSNRLHSMTELKKNGFTRFSVGRMDDKEVSDPLIRDYVKRRDA